MRSDILWDDPTFKVTMIAVWVLAVIILVLIAPRYFRCKDPTDRILGVCNVVFAIVCTIMVWRALRVSEDEQRRQEALLKATIIEEKSKIDQRFNDLEHRIDTQLGKK